MRTTISTVSNTSANTRRTTRNVAHFADDVTAPQPTSRQGQRKPSLSGASINLQGLNLNANRKSPQVGPSPSPFAGTVESASNQPESLAAAMAVLTRHAFFSSLRETAIEPFARLGQRRVYITDGRTSGATSGGTVIYAVPGTPIVVEQGSDMSSDYLYIIEKGRVTIEEAGENLGELEEGCVFGDFVAFGLSSSQPVTVKLTDELLTVWCVPNAVIGPVNMQLSAVISGVQHHMARQWKAMFASRITCLNFFSHCRPHCSEMMMRKLSLKHRKPNQALCYEGEAASSALLVVSGSVVVQPASTSSNRREKVTIGKVVSASKACHTLAERVRFARRASVERRRTRFADKLESEGESLASPRHAGHGVEDLVSVLKQPPAASSKESASTTNQDPFQAGSEDNGVQGEQMVAEAEERGEVRALPAAAAASASSRQEEGAGEEDVNLGSASPVVIRPISQSDTLAVAEVSVQLDVASRSSSFQEEKKPSKQGSERSDSDKIRERDKNHDQEALDSVTREFNRQQQQIVLLRRKMEEESDHEAKMDRVSSEGSMAPQLSADGPPKHRKRRLTKEVSQSSRMSRELSSRTHSNESSMRSSFQKVAAHSSFGGEEDDEDEKDDEAASAAAAAGLKSSSSSSSPSSSSSSLGGSTSSSSSGSVSSDGSGMSDQESSDWGSESQHSNDDDDPAMCQGAEEAGMASPTSPSALSRHSSLGGPAGFSSAGGSSSLSAGDSSSESSSDTSSDDDADVLSDSSDASLNFRPYQLPEYFACLEPNGNQMVGSAGQGGALLIGDAILLGFQSERPRTIVAQRDCIVLELTLQDFMSCLRTHRAETQRFIQMQEASYQEWNKCQVARLHSFDLFRRCSTFFLEALARVVRPVLVYAEEPVMRKDTDSKGLVLLMAGQAERVLPDGSRTTVVSPQTFGSLQWLGAVTKMTDSVLARSLCQVLIVQHHDLIATLKRFPDESTAMVRQVRQHNGQRLTLVLSKRGGDKTGPGARQTRLHMWHLPFCKGADPGFLEWFTVAMEHGNIIPGMPFMRLDEDPDFMVLLTSGTLELSSERYGPREEVSAPLLVCGWDKTKRVQAVAKTVCGIHRLTVRALERLAKEFPENTRTIVNRLMQYQVRNHLALDVNWWNAGAVFRKLPAFEDCSMSFLAEVAKLMELKLFLPGDPLVEEGALSDSTMIIECGRCVVERRSMKCLWSNEVIAEVGDGFWIGGIGGICGFAGELKRTATVRAAEVCKVHNIPTQSFIDLLGSNSVERQRFRAIAERELRAKDSDRLEDHPFFASLPRAFLNLLRPKCRVHVFFGNETLYNEGDPAECMLILNAEACVSMEVGGRREKQLHGRHCLGVLALLTLAPVKRASTVRTLTACAVRVLTKEDWLDALKLFPEHREWLGDFTKEQVAQIGDVRTKIHRRRAWEKIQDRNLAAKQAYWQRRSCGFGRPPPKGPATPAITLQALPKVKRETAPGASITTMSPKKEEAPAALPAPSQASTMKSRPKPQPARQVWPCFNGPGVEMPSVVLPRLTLGTKAIATSDANDSDSMSGLDDDDDTRSVCSRRSIKSDRRASTRQEFDWQHCDRALGLEAEFLARPRCSRGSIVGVRGGSRPSSGRDIPMLTLRSSNSGF